MKIVFAVNTSWNIYNFRIGIVRALLSQGHQVIVVSPRDAYSVKLEEEGCRFYPFSMQQKSKNPLHDLFLFFKYIMAYRKIAPDVVLNFTIKPNIYSTLACRLFNITSINNVSGLGTVFLHKGVSSFIARQLYRLSFRYPEKVFFQNESDRELFISLKLIDRRITDVLPGSGVDIKRFVPGSGPEGAFTFLMVSRFLYDKGVIEYLNAAGMVKKEYPEVVFILAGRSDEEKLDVKRYEIEPFISDNTIQVLPFRDDIENLYRQCSVVVLPSYREGTARTLLEGAASGKPLIASDVPGCREVVHHNKNGFLCKSKSAEDLYLKMKMILKAPEETLKSFGEYSRKLAVEQYDEKKVVGRYLAEINKAPEF